LETTWKTVKKYKKKVRLINQNKKIKNKNITPPPPKKKSQTLTVTTVLKKKKERIKRAGRPRPV